MKHLFTSLFIITGCLSASHSSAQLSTKANRKMTEVNTTTANASATVNGAVNTISTVKNAKDLLFGNKKNKTVNILQIVISNITYDDANLHSLKEKLEKVKGVKAIQTGFADGVATISLEIKKKVTADEIWESVSTDTRAAFEMKAMDDNSITLALKASGNGSNNTNANN